MSEIESFDELQESHQEFVRLARKIKFEAGLRNLLADLYPDNAHFIYELLQNAEDARATEVRFNLFKDRLVATHNGKREFTLGDVERITGIGQSIKKDDPTQIGKFGVGFKAVYTYTNHPEIHSGEFSFVIKDLFVPEKTSAINVGGETVFVFPFDREEKDAATSFAEIARGLNEIGSSTLLFLSSVSAIKFEIEGGQAGLVSRSDSESPRITIAEIKNGGETETSWLRLIGRPEGFPENLTVAAAFKLHDPSGKGAVSTGISKLRVQPVEAGDTCIYFPAVKETSGLRFHIHAPFASTVARDSVRDDPGNAELVAAIGALIVRELPVLRDQGLVDDGLLSALPNIDDVLVAPYDAIRTSIYKAFNETALTPVLGGGAFRPANELVQSPSEFRGGLIEPDLETLLELAGKKVSNTPQWVAPKVGKAGQFLKGLKAQAFGWCNLLEIFDNVESEFLEWESKDEEDDLDLSFLPVWSTWLGSKNDAQLRDFYVLIGFGYFEEEIEESFSLPIIRVSVNGEFEHLIGSRTYLPADKTDFGPNRVPVGLSYFDDDEPNRVRNSLQAFYANFGVKRWDDLADVNVRLGMYRSENFPSETEHLQDLQIFANYLINNPLERLLFRFTRFLLGENSEGGKAWMSQDQLVLDSPYEATGLSLLPIYKYRLWSGYNLHSELIVDFARKIGVKSDFSLIKVSPRKNREYRPSWSSYTKETHAGTQNDFDLLEFESILDVNNPELFRSLWEFVCGKQASYARGVYQANGSSETHRFGSQVCQKLSEGEWVLDRHGYRRSPKSMTLEELAEDWPKPPPNSLASALGFGEESRVQEAVVLERRMQAKSLGLSDELVEAMRDLSEDQQAEAAEYFREIKRISPFPGETSNDPMRRAAFSTVESLVAPLNEKVIRERSVSNGEKEKVKDEAKEYLRQKYTADSKLYCQACHEPASFKYENKWFFEAVEFVGKRDRLLKENYLALCPLCAAKYKYVREPKDNEVLMASVMEWSIDDESPVVELAIALAGKRVNLKFAQTHAISLKAALKAAGETRN